MEQHIIKRREGLKKKLVSNARAMITNQVSIPFGTVKMKNLIYQLENNNTILSINLEIFESYYYDIIHLPIGIERLQYNREYLKRLDLTLDEITLNYKEKIIDKCFEIILELNNKRL